jgi:hypothetical protein
LTTNIGLSPCKRIADDDAILRTAGHAQKQRWIGQTRSVSHSAVISASATGAGVSDTCLDAARARSNASDRVLFGSGANDDVRQREQHDVMTGVQQQRGRIH